MSNSAYKPLISIITVSFNSAKTIRKTIESVLNQTYTNIEYIIIDGNSNDETVPIIKEYELQFQKREINYRWVSETDQGIYDAMNKGIKLADGEWIGILNSDDWYELDVCENVAGSALGFDVVYGLQRYWDNGEIERVLQNHHSRWLSLTMAHSPIFIKKELYTKYGYFDLKYKLAADYKLVVNLTRQPEVRFKMVEKIFSNFALGGASGKNRFKHSNLESLDIQLYFSYLPWWRYILKKIKIKLWR